MGRNFDDYPGFQPKISFAHHCMLMYLIISPFVRCNISFFNFAPRSENMSMKIGFHKNVRDLFFSAAGIYICIAIKLRLGHWLSF